MTTALVLGSGLGLGLWALAVWVAPPLPRLGMVLARATSATPPAPPLLATTQHGWVLRFGGPFVRPQRALGLPSASLRRDLAITGTSIESHLAVKAAATLTGLLAPVVTNLALSAVDMGWGVQIPAIASAVLALAGFVLPDLQMRARAAARRAEARDALSVYLDLVVIALAGGAGVDAALTDASTVGHGWAFTQLRRALAAARITRVSPWQTLRQLGTELDIPELTELAASASLAGTEGAKIRASLSAKAVALRIHQLTEAESQAQSATERMSLPVMTLFTGFLVFIGYPAVDQIIRSL
ncbi:type II secretion system F family protein [Jiangella muralis]|uniref:type II secretion system F family protein n=1 Tax=Jiangella muralis TaxID=702383 RepID=UPI00069E6F4F|nr:type II secretion system F family protein [Jiangella muralis]